jgi:RNA polymerase sigma factor (sigma-70 family)
MGTTTAMAGGAARGRLLPMDEPDWGRRLAADLDGAFPSFVRATQDGLYGGILRLVGDARDAEDIAQEVYLRAYRSLTDMPGARRRQLKARPWLWTIAINRCRTRGGQQARRPTEVELDAFAIPDPVSIEEREVDARMWHDRLASLSSDQRTAVVLRHAAGLSYRDISDVTGRPEGTVKADVHRGIAALRGILEEEIDHG